MRGRGKGDPSVGTSRVSTLAALLTCRVVLASQPVAMLTCWRATNPAWSLALLSNREAAGSRSPETLGGKRSLERHLCSGRGLLAIVLKRQYVEPIVHSHLGNNGTAPKSQ